MIIEKVGTKNLEHLISLLGEYQSFYEVESNREKNHKFLSGLIYKGDEAVFHVIYEDNVPIGFSGIYFSFSSVSAKKIAILNDLYVISQKRRLGVGKLLIRHAIDHIKNLGISHVRWCTKEENTNAQKLYDEFLASSSKWVHYDKGL